MSSPLLAVRELAIDLPAGGDWRRVLSGVEFEVEAASIVGLVGASGAGKSVTALSILGLLPAIKRISGEIELAGDDLLTLSAAQMESVRGRRIGMVFQEPMSALNPLLTVGEQITEGLRKHRSLGRREARHEAQRLLELVVMPAPERRLRDYPHQLSGGQRQRAMIAIALAGQPELLIADEPTTALDVTIQAQILRLLEALSAELEISILLITHDLAVVAETCERVVVLDAGRVVEHATVAELFRNPAHRSSRTLVELAQRLNRLEPSPGAQGPAGEPGQIDGPEPLVEGRKISKRYPIYRGVLQRLTAEAHALDAVDVAIAEGECLAIVGESGSGKTTLGNCLLRLIEPSEGEIFVDGEDLRVLTKSGLRAKRRHLQVVFQDPDAALDPRMRVGRLLSEPLEIHTTLGAAERRDRVEALLRLVELPAELESRLPHELSTGQKQRIGIARALATEPRFLVADEPVSALDLGVRAEILELLDRLRQQLGLAILLISHDLSVMPRIADRVAVMYCGRIVEQAPTARLFAHPQHPYTVSLLAAIPVADPAHAATDAALGGEAPDLASPPPGCRFHPRCPIAEERCRVEGPELVELDRDHVVACHHPGDLARRA